MTSSSRRNTPCRATTRPSGARGSPPSLYERHDLRRELLERVARHSPAARSTPSSCVIQHAATDLLAETEGFAESPVPVREGAGFRRELPGGRAGAVSKSVVLLTRGPRVASSSSTDEIRSTQVRSPALAASATFVGSTSRSMSPSDEAEVAFVSPSALRV